MFGLKLQVRVELGDGLPKGVAVPYDLADRRLTVSVQQSVENRGHNGHGLQRDMVAIDQLHIRPCPVTIFGRGGAFATRADGIETPWIERHGCLESEVTDPVIDEVIDVGQALPPMQAQRRDRHMARIDIKAGTARPRAAVFHAVDTEVMQMQIAPREDDLERGMEGGQGHITADEEATPDQWADPLHHHPELIDMRWSISMFHGRRVPQGS